MVAQVASWVQAGEFSNQGVEDWGDTFFFFEVTPHPHSGKRETYFMTICIQKIKAKKQVLGGPLFSRGSLERAGPSAPARAVATRDGFGGRAPPERARDLCVTTSVF